MLLFTDFLMFIVAVPTVESSPKQNTTVIPPVTARLTNGQAPVHWAIPLVGGSLFCLVLLLVLWLVLRKRCANKGKLTKSVTSSTDPEIGSSQPLRPTPQFVQRQVQRISNDHFHEQGQHNLLARVSLFLSTFKICKITVN